jgi:UDP-sugar transporter A1/2/3
MLKKSDVKLGVWHRNFQLAFFSVLFLYCVILYEFYSSNTAPQASYPVMFQGWTKTAVLITLVQSGGGLLVAATLKFADSILKTLATSGAIFLSAVLGRVLLNGQLDMFVALGGFTTIIAIFNYSFDATP